MKTEKTTTPAVKTKAHVLILEARYYADLCDELAKGALRRACPRAPQREGGLTYVHRHNH